MRHLIVVVAIAGCSNGKSLAEVIGKRIEPPGGLRLGMTAAEAKAALPSLGEGFGGAGSAGGSSPGAFLGKDAQLIANIKDGRIAQLIVACDESRVSNETVQGAIIDQWGPPEAARGPFGPVLEWKSMDTGWRAQLKVDPALTRIEFTPYRPVTAAFFGAKVSPPGTLARLRVGMTFAEAKAALPDLVASDSAGQIATADGGGDDLRVMVFFDAERQIASMELELPSLTDATKLVTAAWSAGTPGDKGSLVWSDTATGWRAELVPVDRHESEDRITKIAALQFVPLAR